METNNKRRQRKPGKKHGCVHVWVFRILYVLIVFGLLYAIYQFVKPFSKNVEMSEEQKETDAQRKAEYDTIDVVGDYFGSKLKLDADKSAEEKKDEKEEAKKVEPAPQASAATEQDIEEAVGGTDVVPKEELPTIPAEPSKAEKMDAPEVEVLD